MSARRRSAVQRARQAGDWCPQPSKCGRSAWLTARILWSKLALHQLDSFGPQWLKQYNSQKEASAISVAQSS